MTIAGDFLTTTSTSKGNGLDMSWQANQKERATKHNWWAVQYASEVWVIVRLIDLIDFNSDWDIDAIAQPPRIRVSTCLNDSTRTRWNPTNHGFSMVSKMERTGRFTPSWWNYGEIMWNWDGKPWLSADLYLRLSSYIFTDFFDTFGVGASTSLRHIRRWGSSSQKWLNVKHMVERCWKHEPVPSHSKPIS